MKNSEWSAIAQFEVAIRLVRKEVSKETIYELCATGAVVHRDSAPVLQMVDKVLGEIHMPDGTTVNENDTEHTIKLRQALADLTLSDERVQQLCKVVYEIGAASNSGAFLIHEVLAMVNLRSTDWVSKEFLAMCDEVYSDNEGSPDYDIEDLLNVQKGLLPDCLQDYIEETRELIRDRADPEYKEFQRLKKKFGNA